MHTRTSRETLPHHFGTLADRFGQRRKGASGDEAGRCFSPRRPRRQLSAVCRRSILESVGAEAEKERIDHLLSEVKGKDIAELIAAGREKFASVPSGGAVAASPLASSVGGAAAEPKKEEKEESDEDMGFSLFD